MSKEIVVPATQSSDAAEKRLANLKPFEEGVSGNPGGRPKGLQRRVREEFGNDGDGLVALLAGVIANQGEKTTDPLEAARILLERGWCKAGWLVVIRSAARPNRRCRSMQSPAPLQGTFRAPCCPASSRQGSLSTATIGA
jgi:hypothetical protein